MRLTLKILTCMKRHLFQILKQPLTLKLIQLLNIKYKDKSTPQVKIFYQFTILRQGHSNIQQMALIINGQCFAVFFLFMLAKVAYLQSFCSAFCGYNMCTGPTNTSCSGCDYPFTLSGTTCVPSNGFQIVAYASDFLINETKTASCGIYNYIGNFNHLDRVRIEYTVTVPHYQVHLLAWVIFIDQWAVIDDITIKQMNGPNTFSILDIPNLPATKICSPSSWGDTYAKLSQSWAHTSTTNSVQIQFKGYSNYNSPWGIKQYTLLARLCHPNCILCYGGLQTECTSCAAGNYLSVNTCSSTCPSGKGYPTSPSVTCITCAINCQQCYYASVNCTKCSSTTFLNQAANTCVTTCPAFTGPNTNDRTCYPCTDNTYCQACTANTSECIQCVASMILFTDNDTCVAACPSAYSNISGICILCHQTCLGCTGTTQYDCISCTSAYLYRSGVLCDSTCKSLYGIPATGYTCIPCDSLCLECYASATNCSSCIGSAYHKSDSNQCLVNCPSAYLANSSTMECDNCDMGCSLCVNSVLNCTSCFAPFVFFNYSCQNSCPRNYYNNTGLCTLCDSSCQECTGDPNPCTYCSSGFFLDSLASSCGISCPAGYFAYQFNRTCMSCSNFCVLVAIDVYFPNEENPKNIHVDISFSRAMNFTTFPYQSFQKFTFSDKIPINKLSYQYKILNQTTYRIIISIIGTVNLTNASVMCSTISISTSYKSAQDFPLDSSAYSQSDSALWTIVKYPQLEGISKQFVFNMSIINNWFTNISTMQYVQQIQKSGILSMLFSGAQMTSLVTLRSKSPPQNMYEGCRFWAMFIYFDVPDWELDSNKTKYIVVPPSNQAIASSRLLLEINQIQFRFRRTGFTTFFLFDCYMNIIFLLVGWISLMIGYLLSIKFQIFKRNLSFFYNFLHKIHEISLFYVVIASVLQWSYFEPTSAVRIGSIIINLVFMVYFLIYHLYIYRDLMSYPLATIGDEKYNYYVQKYGYFLKNIRYEQYSRKQSSCWHFPYLRPYNFHIFSFYKKVLMIAALPLFSGIDYTQMSILAILQTIQICRVILVRPFYKLWRNLVRIGLELVLLSLIIFCLVDQVLFNAMALDLNTTTKQQIQIYETIGWIQFGLIFVFNLGYLVLMIFDLVTSFIWNNRYRIYQARKGYFLREFEQLDMKVQKELQNKQLLMQKTLNLTKSIVDTPKSRNSQLTAASKYSKQQKSLIKKWIKSGNLVEKQEDQINLTKAKIQEYKIQKHQKEQTYYVKIYRAFDLYVHLKVQKHKNITTTSKLEKQLVFTNNPSSDKFHVSAIQTLPTVNNPFFYKIIDQIFQHYRQLTTESIYVKTFMRVDMSKYILGQEIPIVQQDMFQVIIQESFSKSRNIQKLEKPYKPFPISRKILQSLKQV